MFTPDASCASLPANDVDRKKSRRASGTRLDDRDYEEGDR